VTKCAASVGDEIGEPPQAIDLWEEETPLLPHTHSCWADGFSRPGGANVSGLGVVRAHIHSGATWSFGVLGRQWLICDESYSDGAIDSEETCRWTASAHAAAPLTAAGAVMCGSRDDGHLAGCCRAEGHNGRL